MLDWLFTACDRLSKRIIRARLNLRMGIFHRVEIHQSEVLVNGKKLPDEDAKRVMDAMDKAVDDIHVAFKSMDGAFTNINEVFREMRKRRSNGH